MTTTSSTPDNRADTGVAVRSSVFGTLPDGREVTCYALHAGGMILRVLNRGGVVLGWEIPDGRGGRVDIVTGLDRLEDYLADVSYHGALVGRYANRIAGGGFTLDGETFALAKNDAEVNHLHGGPDGFHVVYWEVRAFEDDGSCGVTLRHVSPDGHEGYPGALSVEVIYRLIPPGTWRIEYRATTTKPTVLNLTQHAYFNLAGHDAGAYADHRMRLWADQYLPVRLDGIPTGALQEVEGTVYDFRSPRAMQPPEGDRAPGMYEAGYDHPYVVRGTPGVLRPAAEVVHPDTGRRLTVRTTQPGLQYYAGYHLNLSPVTGKQGKPYVSYGAFALEAQHHPDSPNRPDFPSTVLRPGETFLEITEYSVDTAG